MNDDLCDGCAIKKTCGCPPIYTFHSITYECPCLDCLVKTKCLTSSSCQNGAAHAERYDRYDYKGKKR